MKALAFLGALLVVGCSSSHSIDEGGDGGDSDLGIVIDVDGAIDAAGDAAVQPDGDIDASVDAPPPAECGNGVTEPGESCDDGNETDDDVCANDCSWNGFCGNEVTEEGEVCDDGNTFSADGCSADCQSREVCGNGIRDIAVGEVCDDDSGTCAEDCRSIVGCGNGVTAGAELCDDGNALRWDGCGTDCLPEVSMVVNSFQVAAPSTGCDYTGDGRADNRFSAALGSLTAILNGQISEQISGGGLTVLLSLLGLEDATVTNDSSLRVGWMQGNDVDGIGSNNFSGTNEFTIASGQLDDSGNPLTTFYGSLTSRALVAGPEDFVVSLGLPFPIQLRRGRISGTVTSSVDTYGIEDATVCGVVSVSTLATAPNILAMFGLSSTACDSGAEASLGDLIVGGRRGFPMIAASQPDVDVDGDGLERFEVLTTGPANCQPVIVACIDGDGTRYEGRDCAVRDEFADGLSVGLDATAVGAVIVGAED